MEKVVKSDEEWRKQLTPEQFWVTRQKGTERPFTGDYYHFKGEGTYLCVAVATSFSARIPSTSPARDGRAFGRPHRRKAWMWKGIPAMAWSGLRSCAAGVTLTWDTCSRMVPSQPACAIASTRLRSILRMVRNRRERSERTIDVRLFESRGLDIGPCGCRRHGGRNRPGRVPAPVPIRQGRGHSVSACAQARIRGRDPSPGY